MAVGGTPMHGCAAERRGYPIFMGTAEYIGYEPSGRAIVGEGEQTDLDLLLADFAGQANVSRPGVDVFEFAREHYDEKSFRRKDQTVRGTLRGLKTSFAVPFRETAERLDPPYYLLRYQAGELIESLTPLGDRIKERKKKFRPRTDAELDAEYALLSVSSDGTVTLNERVKGEDFKQMKRVGAGDVVYNPMRINIGSIGVVPPELAGGMVSPDDVVFRCEGIDPHFLVTLLRSPFYRTYLDGASTGSIRDRVYFRDLQTIRVPPTTEAEQATVCEAARKVGEEAHALLDRIAADKAGVLDRVDDIIRSASTAKQFRELADRWREETGMLSSVSKILNHPAYRAVVEMGRADRKGIVPLIL